MGEKQAADYQAFSSPKEDLIPTVGDLIPTVGHLMQ